MAYQNNRRKNRSSLRIPRSKQLMLVGVAFISGYLTASLFDVQQLSLWLNTHSPSDSSLLRKTQLVSKPTEPPKPKLEFYTLLTANHEVSVETPPTPAIVPSAPSPQLIARAAPIAAQLALNSKAKSIPSVAVTARPIKPVIAVKPHAVTNMSNNYSIQVAAFRTREDAERVKATLLIKGFDVSINAAPSQNTMWFRVVVGPFASREQALRAQTLLARRDRLNGMIRKMDA